MNKVFSALLLVVASCGQPTQVASQTTQENSKPLFQGCRPTASECRYSFPCEGRRLMKVEPTICPEFGSHPLDKIACFCDER